MGCATKKRLVTFAHGYHKDLKVGEIVDVYSVVGNNPYKVKVLLADHKHDFVLLECDQELCAAEFARALPYEGEDYIQLGLSALTQHESPFSSVSRGTVTSTRLNSNGHILGSAGANPGDSGGGCYAEKSNTLYGVNVGCDAVSISGDTTLNQMGTRHPARAHIVPSSFFDVD